MITDGELAIAAAQAGAEIVRSRFGAAHSRLDKGGGDFATDTDVEAERVIVDLLRAHRPGDAVLGEESGRTGSAPDDRTWMVDPLCGTLNYAVRTHLVAVNVALRSGAAAASADPFTGEVFWTDGRTAGVRRDGADEQLVPSPSSSLVDVNLDPPFPNGSRFRAVDLLGNRDFAARYRPRVVSTTLAVAWVAAGRRAAYVTDGHGEDSVHFAAGIAVCRAAGCVVTALDGSPPRTGRGGLLIAADSATHTDLLSLIGL
ncbi:inositol monophosphatase family protein [Actinoplanes sp. NPDC049596]|uniref:inositol monophosphatase family protein n=1 Tax=unclassified Actinoplanes TaxID=2626549 RepID=UPI0034483A52